MSLRVHFEFGFFSNCNKLLTPQTFCYWLETRGIGFLLYITASRCTGASRTLCMWRFLNFRYQTFNANDVSTRFPFHQRRRNAETKIHNFRTRGFPLFKRFGTSFADIYNVGVARINVLLRRFSLPSHATPRNTDRVDSHTKMWLLVCLLVL